MPDIQWHIQLLGGLQAQRADRTLTHFQTRKAATLLGWLALHLQRTHSREVLAEMLWPEEEPEVVRDRFRQALAAVRRALEPSDLPNGGVVLADRADVRLNPEAVQTDVGRFEAALHAVTRAPSSSASRLSALLEAISAYQGELMPGYYEDWILTERERLADRYRYALREAAGALAENGEIDRALDLARRAVESDPLQEETQTLLMRLYLQAGRRADALHQYRHLEQLLQAEIGQAPSPATRRLLEQILAPEDPAAASPGMSPVVFAVATDMETPIPAEALRAQKIVEGLPGRIPEQGKPSVPKIVLEPEGGAVPLDSTFYLYRPTDQAFTAAVTRGDSIVLVKGARQTGKTSLLARGLQQAREAGARVLLTDMQKLTGAQMATADSLFYTIADTMIETLDLDLDLATLWKPHRGWNVNFERFLRREVLGKLDGHLVWGLDEIDRLFGTAYSADVFGLFRSWHNERSLDPSGPWSKLTLSIAYATAAHLFITDLNQSPFNVGTRLALDDFTPQEVAEMNRRYDSPLRTQAELARHYDLVGGNPYLVRRSLHALATKSLELAAFEQQADRDNGVFGDSLRRMLTALRQDPTLAQAVIQLLQGQNGISGESFYRLQSAGVVIGTSAHDMRFRCQLYRRYLAANLL